MRTSRLLEIVAATAALTVTGLMGLGTAGAASNFTTLNNQADPTFNQLLGINDQGVIAGYFGSGDTGHPNQGYTAQLTLRPGELRQRELPRVGPDPGHRHQQQRQHGRLLGRHPRPQLRIR